MSSSQSYRERLAAPNTEKREVRLQHEREPQGAASAKKTWPFASPTYSTVCCTYSCTGGVLYSQNHLPATPHL